MEKFNVTSEEKKLLRVDKGIAYFEDGWWMLDSDRWELELKRLKFERPQIKANNETKQIEIDYTVYP